MEDLAILFLFIIITIVGVERGFFNSFYDNAVKNFDKKLAKELKELDNYWKGVVSTICGDTIVDVVKLDPDEITIIFENLNCKIIRIKDYKLVNKVKDIYGNLQLKLIKENEKLKFENEQLKNKPTTVCYMKPEDIGMAKIYNEKYWYYIPSSDCNTCISQDEYDKLSEEDKQKYKRIG